MDGLRDIIHEDLNHRLSLEQRGVQDPTQWGKQLPRIRPGVIDEESAEYDERVSELFSVVVLQLVPLLLL